MNVHELSCAAGNCKSNLDQAWIGFRLQYTVTESKTLGIIKTIVIATDVSRH
jgi:hypothetical protein